MAVLTMQGSCCPVTLAHCEMQFVSHSVTTHGNKAVSSLRLSFWLVRWLCPMALCLAAVWSVHGLWDDESVRLGEHKPCFT